MSIPTLFTQLNASVPGIVLGFILVAVLAACSPVEKPLTVIAHRGASAYLPEHSLAAKALAHHMNADFIEQDVVISRDNHAIVFHDLHLEQVTDVVQRFPNRARPDGHYYVVDFDLAEIKTLQLVRRINMHGDAVFPSRPEFDQVPFRISTLDEEITLIQALNKLSANQAGLYVEIKAPEWHKTEGKDISRLVLAILSQHGYIERDDNIYLQSFSASELKRIKYELGSQLKLVQLIGDERWDVVLKEHASFRTPQGLSAIAEYAEGVGVWVKHIVTHRDEKEMLVVSGLVDDAHRAGLSVHAYTLRKDSLPSYVNNFEELVNTLMQAGVDGVFTDFPDLLKE
ncbi:glycerophosphodiester phosphodiesterase [Pseudomonadota bacterium]